MVRLGIFLPGLFLLASRSFAQDLDPRAYMRLPLKTTTAFTGFAYSRGGVVTDPTLSLKKYSSRRSVDFIWCFPSIQFFWSHLAGIVSNSLFLGTSSRRCTATCRPHHPYRFCIYVGHSGRRLRCPNQFKRNVFWIFTLVFGFLPPIRLSIRAKLSAPRSRWVHFSFMLVITSIRFYG